jgi:hypothetical protein
MCDHQFVAPKVDVLMFAKGAETFDEDEVPEYHSDFDFESVIWNLNFCPCLPLNTTCLSLQRWRHISSPPNNPHTITAEWARCVDSGSEK